MLEAAVTWPEVALAAIGVVPSTIAAVGVLLNRRMLKTPSGTPIGAQVEDTNHIALITHKRLFPEDHEDARRKDKS